MNPRFAVLGSFSGAGGVEHMMINLVEEFARRGWRFDLLVLRADSPHLRDLPANVNVAPVGTRHAVSSIPYLARYLRRTRPAALLVAKDRAGRAALLARRIALTDTRIVVRLGTNLSEAVRGRSALQRWWRTAPMRALYADVSTIVAVSDGVAEDTRHLTGLPAERIRVIRNPVITPALQQQAEAPVPHPWLLPDPGRAPVVIGVGRLTQQKDFATLLEAWARVRRDSPLKLVILGDGRLRRALEQRAAALGFAADVALPGFQANPYAWVARADLFVLSSRWEGSPNALTEALALGVPSVSTDCPSGPREILDGGRYGPLVPPGDVDALAGAIAATLASPLRPPRLREAVAEYNADTSATRYLAALGLPPFPDAPHAAI